MIEAMPPEKPKVKPETDYSYTNKFTKKELRFAPKEDEVVATFAPGADEDVPRSVMAESSLAVSRGVNLERGFAVFHVGAETDPRGPRRSLGERPEVANTMPVLIDDEGLTRYFLPDELTVQFRDDVPAERAEATIAEMGSEIVTRQRTPGYYTITVPEGRGLFETLREWSDREDVLFAEPSEAGFDDALVYVPDDPDFGDLWGLNNTGQRVNGVTGTAACHVDATQAWDITRGASSVVVAVIDTGGDLDHPDLAGNLFPRGSEDWDFADSGDPVPDDANGHGTHVAGTVAAIDNGIGVIGLAPRCRVMPLRINLTAGMNQNRADAINYVAAQAAANPARRYVVNCSWKMSGDHAGVRNAIINAVNNNVVVCFAAGNDNQNTDLTPQYPGVYPEAISVAATDQRDRKASFSNFGRNVDVAAPGVNILSTYPNDRYTFLDGTSMACPHVAALAALVWSRNPTLTNQQVRQTIEDTCDDVDVVNPSFAGRLGRGRINAFRALSATPPAPLGFTVVRQLPFPQASNGASSALAFARRLQSGFTFRPALLFLTQQPFSERIFFLNPATGAVLRSIDPVANDTIGSLEWVNGRVRAANVSTGAGSVNTIDPVTGAQTGSIPAPEGRGEGLAYDGTVLYYSTVSRIHALNPATGAVVRSFPPPGGPCRGLAFGRGFLFSANSSAGTITVFDPSTLAVRATIEAPGGGAAQAEGLAFNPAANELFVANQSENTIYVGRVTF